MKNLRVQLFHRFQVKYVHEPLEIEGSKVQELFAYLVLFRAKAHSRETLADQLWRDAAAGHARRYLSKALWQLQSAFDRIPGFGHSSILTIGTAWIQVSPAVEIWTDVSALERAYTAILGLPGSELCPTHVRCLQAATRLYSGDLLEGWYHEWCLLERQRFQYMYLAILDRLTDYYESKTDFEAAIQYAAQILHHDRARERTHRQLMRLFYLAGDRTEALQQYDRCVDTLRRYLDVPPDAQTIELYNRIKIEEAIEPPTASQPAVKRQSPDLFALLDNLLHIQAELEMTQHQVAKQINRLKALTGTVTAGGRMSQGD